MRKSLLAVGLFCALASCQTAAPPKSKIAAGAPYLLSSAEAGFVDQGVRTILKDPDSARFEGLRASKDEKGVVTVCGYVNARNSFGGYTGGQPFMGVLFNNARVPNSAKFIPVGIGSETAKSMAIRRVCQESGILI